MPSIPWYEDGWATLEVRLSRHAMTFGVRQTPGRQGAEASPLGTWLPGQHTPAGPGTRHVRTFGRYAFRAEKRRLIESRAVRSRGLMKLVRVLLVAVGAALVLVPFPASAQVNITPNFSITPSSSVTKWIVWMALGAIILAVLVLLFLGTGYMRFGPKFFGREEAPKRPPPGVRPPLMTRTGPSSRPPVAQSPGTRVATAVTERPAAPAAGTPPRPSVPSQPAAQPAASAQPAAPSQPTAQPAATSQPTAPPSGEPAVQSDAVGEAEARVPEARPTAKTPEEVGAQPDEAVAQAPTTAEQSEAGPQPEEAEAAPQPERAEAAPQPVPQPAEPAAAPAAHGQAAALDQETFDRVLEEQLGKGVDRRVAEGRARAAAVVAARKKAQG
jgi:hypothetical protein